MVRVTYPGVYIQEVPSGVHTITGVATSIAAFVDYFAEGRTDEAGHIFSLADFNRMYGGLDAKSEASYAISQFFLNGGTEAYVVRVVDSSAAKAAAEIYNLPAQAANSGPTAPAATTNMTLTAIDEGKWGNNVRVVIDYKTIDPDTRFNMTVTRYAGTDSGAGIVATEKFTNLTITQGDSRYFKDVVNAESDLIRVDPGANMSLPPASGTYGVKITATGNALTTLLDGFAGKSIVLTVGPSGTQHTVTFDAWNAGVVKDLYGLRAKLEAAIQAQGTHDNEPVLAGATVSLIGTRFLIQGAKVANVDFGNDVIHVANAGDHTADNLGFAGHTENVPEYVLGYQDAHNDVAFESKLGTLGANGGTPTAKNLTDALSLLDTVDLFNILCMPIAFGVDPSTGGDYFNDTQRTAILSAAIQYCQDHRAFMIVDIPKDVDGMEKMQVWMAKNDGLRSDYAAVYFPRVEMPDPLNGYRTKSLGASGTMAGLYSRTDSTRGVWKAPAGTEATLKGLSGLDTLLTDAENGVLNQLGINCLRGFPVYGNVSWGARTLDGADQLASDWKYVPIRRLALFIEESLFRGTKWVVFEPNDEPLWAKIRLNVGVFMQSLFRQGAFQGSTPDKAYFVKCDGETTTQDDRNKGIVNIEVGFAPLKPAEFVVIKIQQIAGDL